MCVARHPNGPASQSTNNSCSGVPGGRRLGRDHWLGGSPRRHRRVATGSRDRKEVGEYELRNVFQGRKINQFTITTLNANMLCKFKARDIIYLPGKRVKTNPQVFIGDVKFRKSMIPPPYCSSCSIGFTCYRCCSVFCWSRRCSFCCRCWSWRTCRGCSRRCEGRRTKKKSLERPHCSSLKNHGLSLWMIR